MELSCNDFPLESTIIIYLLLLKLQFAVFFFGKLCIHDSVCSQFTDFLAGMVNPILIPVISFA